MQFEFVPLHLFIFLAECCHGHATHRGFLFPFTESAGGYTRIVKGEKSLLREQKKNLREAEKMEMKRRRVMEIREWNSRIPIAHRID
jgi:hypothetical protein